MTFSEINSRDGAFRGRGDQRRVLGENAALVARLGLAPVGQPVLDLLVLEVPVQPPRPPVFFSGVVTGRTTSCPGVSFARRASSPMVRPLAVIWRSSTKPPSTRFFAMS